MHTTDRHWEQLTFPRPALCGLRAALGGAKLESRAERVAPGREAGTSSKPMAISPASTSSERSRNTYNQMSVVV